MPVYIVERYWSQVSAADVEVLVGRLRVAVAGTPGVVYFGSVLLVDDEVVQCRFDAPDIAAVERVNQVAQAPYDRILRACAYPG